MPARLQLDFRSGLLALSLGAVVGLATVYAVDQYDKTHKGEVSAAELDPVAAVASAPVAVNVVGTTAHSYATSLQEANGSDHPQLRAVQQYIGNKYRVSQPHIQNVVKTAWDVGQSREMDPLLLLAVMAVESSFDPKAQSHMGAQGLMQVMTRIHHERFEPHGGIKAAFKPEANIDVGAQILQECIDRRGSVAAGLTCYVGAPGKTSSYGQKVLAEFDRLRVAAGIKAKPTAVAPAPAPVAVRSTAEKPANPVAMMAEESAPISALRTVVEGAAPATIASQEAPGVTSMSSTTPAPAVTSVAETLLAAADDLHLSLSLNDEKALIEAPPISRLVEATASRVARGDADAASEALDL